MSKKFHVEEAIWRGTKRQSEIKSEPKVPNEGHDEAKYVEERALILLTISFHPNESKNREKIKEYKAFIRQIVKEIEDKHWAEKEYLNDTIKELGKQLDEKKPKVSKDRAYSLFIFSANCTFKEFRDELKEIGVEVTDE